MARLPDAGAGHGHLGSDAADCAGDFDGVAAASDVPEPPTATAPSAAVACGREVYSRLLSEQSRLTIRANSVKTVRHTQVRGEQHVLAFVGSTKPCWPPPLGESGDSWVYERDINLGAGPPSECMAKLLELCLFVVS